jgi:hypothetical protein
MCKLDTLALDTVKWLPCINAMLNSWTYGREFLDLLTSINSQIRSWVVYYVFLTTLKRTEESQVKKPFGLAVLSSQTGSLKKSIMASVV